VLESRRRTARIRSRALVFGEAVVVGPGLVAADAFSLGANEICERRAPVSEHHPGLICRNPHVTVIGTVAGSHEPVVAQELPDPHATVMFS